MEKHSRGHTELCGSGLHTLGVLGVGGGQLEEPKQTGPPGQPFLLGQAALLCLFTYIWIMHKIFQGLCG